MDLILYQAVLTRLEICVIHAIGVDELLILRSLLLRLCCFSLRRGVLKHLGDVLLSQPGMGQARGREKAETRESKELLQEAEHHTLSTMHEAEHGDMLGGQGSVQTPWNIPGKA